MRRSSVRSRLLAPFSTNHTMNIQEFLEQYTNEDAEPILTMDGFDEAFIGVENGVQPRAVYDVDRILEVLCRDMSMWEAIEYFHHNIEGAYVGPATPLIIKAFRQQSLI